MRATSSKNCPAAQEPKITATSEPIMEIKPTKNPKEMKINITSSRIKSSKVTNILIKAWEKRRALHYFFSSNNAFHFFSSLRQKRN